MTDVKDKKPVLKGPKDRVLQWTDDPGPAVAYIRTDLPTPNLITSDPLPSKSSKRKLRRFPSQEPVTQTSS
jgi:hypothetical protein